MFKATNSDNENNFIVLRHTEIIKVNQYVFYWYLRSI